MSGTILAAPSARRRRRGQAMVEFALVFPIFLALVFGLIDVGRLVFMHSALSQAAREGARLAAVEASWIGKGGTSTECTQNGGAVICPADVNALRADILAAANRMVAPFGPIVLVGGLYTSCDDTTPPTGAWTTTTCTSHDSGDLVSVRVLLTFTPSTPGLSRLAGPISASGAATMLIN